MQDLCIVWKILQIALTECTLLQHNHIKHPLQISFLRDFLVFRRSIQWMVHWGMWQISHSHVAATLSNGIPQGVAFGQYVAKLSIMTLSCEICQMDVGQSQIEIAPAPPWVIGYVMVTKFQGLSAEKINRKKEKKNLVSIELNSVVVSPHLQRFSQQLYYIQLTSVVFNPLTFSHRLI